MSTKQIKIILGVLAAIFFISALFLYKANIAIGSTHKFDDGILNLKFIDNEMTFSLNNISSISNYDKLNIDINAFDTNLSNLAMLSDGILPFYKNGIKKDLQKIKEVFNKKAYITQRSAYINSSINSYILVSQYEIYNLALPNKLEPIFYAIKGALLLSPKAIEDISNQIKIYKNDYKNNAKVQNVLDKILYAAQGIKALRANSNSAKELHLDNLLENFRDKVLKIHSDVVDNSKRAQIICFITFIIFCMLSLYQIKIATRHLRQIKLLRTTVNNGHSSIVYCDNRNKISYVNKTFEEKTGYKLKDVIGKDPKILKSYMHPQSFYVSIKEAVQKAIPWETDELISRTKSGDFLYEKVKFSPFFFRNKLEGYIAVKLDRTKETLILNELTQKNEQIKIQSSIDKLTGFGNYFALTEILEAKKDGVLICLSVKNFKNLRFFYQTRIIDAMLKGGLFCNSDKYSFLLAISSIINRIPQSIREMMAHDNIFIQGADVENKDKPAYIRRMYLQDIYRFFRLCPLNSSFTNPFVQDKFGWKGLFFLNKLIMESHPEKEMKELGYFLLHRKKYTLLQQLVTDNPLIKEDKDGLYLQACSAFKQAEYERANELYAQLLSMAPEDKNILRGAAQAGFAVNDFARAEECYAIFIFSS